MCVCKWVVVNRFFGEWVSAGMCEFVNHRVTQRSTQSKVEVNGGFFTTVHSQFNNMVSVLQVKEYGHGGLQEFTVKLKKST